MSADDPLARYGAFAAVFRPGELSVPGHLPLLGLQGSEVDIVLDRIAVTLAEAPHPGIEALLADRNWRPNLVAACAYLLDTNRVLDPDLLWRAVDQGSWVAPQLVVAALFVDSGFVEKARARIAGRCRLSADVPRRGGEPSPKNVASLLAAAGFVPSLASWREAMIEDAEVAALLRADDEWDRSAGIVTHWKESAVRVFAKRGITLRHPG